MTTPTGRLAWGQAGQYDAVDDRTVITAVTRNRIGLVWPAEVVAGTGLNIILRGGWLGVTNCGDKTSAVVGSREDQVLLATPGPGSGTRTDVLWCDTNPDEGYWELRVLPVADTINRPGIPMAIITVPAGANLASQMGIEPTDATLERRLLSYRPINVTFGDNQNAGWGDTSWAGAVNASFDSSSVMMEPGQWYRVRAVYFSPCRLNGSPHGRIGLGFRTSGQPGSSSVLTQTASFVMPPPNNNPPREATQAQVEYVFRHGRTDPRLLRIFDTRMWVGITGGVYQIGSPGQNGNHGMLTVEDLGS